MTGTAGDPQEQPPARRIAIEHDGRRFGCRVSAVVVDGARVLLHRSETDAFWSLPGGGVHVGETAVAALRREMVEEMGTEVEVVMGMRGRRRG